MYLDAIKKKYLYRYIINKMCVIYKATIQKIPRNSYKHTNNIIAYFIVLKQNGNNLLY